jgi:hypothetical protein
LLDSQEQSQKEIYYSDGALEQFLLFYM